MANIGSFLQNGQSLAENQSLISANGCFTAVMQGDGNFCVYRNVANGGVLWAWAGSPQSGGPFTAAMQSDGNFVIYAAQKPNALWASLKMALPLGEYFLTMQPDGNLVVYAGTPASAGAAIWASSKMDAPVSFTAQSITYDLDNATMSAPEPMDLYTQTVSNSTNTTQASTITGTKGVSETVGWANAFGVKVGVKTTLTTGVPLVVEGKLEISAEVTDTFTWNESTTTTTTVAFSAPVSVPPGETYQVTIIATNANYSVPYTLTGVYTLTSGIQVPGVMQGVYTGSNVSDTHVEYKNLTTGTAVPNEKLEITKKNGLTLVAEPVGELAAA